MTGPGRPLPIDAPVDADDGHDLARCAGEERLVGVDQIRLVEHAFAPQAMPSAAHSSSTNARVMPGNRPWPTGGVRTTPPSDHEEIRLAALGQVTFVVAHHGLKRAARQRLLHGQGVVEQVVRFDLRVQRFAPVALDVDQRDLDTRARTRAGAAACGVAR